MPASLRTIIAYAFLILTLPPATAQEPQRPEPGHREDAVPAPVAPVDRDSLPRSPRAIVMAGQHMSVQVNVDSQGQNIVGDAANEPSMAIDPTNPNVFVIGWRQFDTIASDFRQAGYAYTSDGGATWTFPGVLDPGQFRSDPVLDTDSAGNFYYYSLSSVTTGEYFVSTDGGVSWTNPIPAPAGDKNWQTIDKDNDHVYADWNSQFTCCAPGTDYTRSTDGAASFGGPWVMQIHPKWGTLTAGPDGALYVAGATLDQSSHVVLRSDNADNALVDPTFALATTVNMGGTTGSGGAPNPGGLLGQIWIAVDHSGGATNGNVYVLGSVNPPGSDPLDVHFIRSTDDGQSWTAPLAVNDNPGDGSYQWFGTMSVSPEGRIDVVWNDTRGSAATTSVLHYAYSTDAGDSFSAALAVSPAFDSTLGHPQQNKIGDYYQLLSSTHDAALAWSATFNGEQDVYFLRVGDCNGSGAHDSVDIAQQTSNDVNSNGIPDECEPDCNGNGVPDSVDLEGESDDCNGNFVPDECDISSGDSEDCNENGRLDECDVSVDLESDPGFTVGDDDDTATTGVWVRVDPVGTAAQPEDDHTTDPGSFCYVTGQGQVGGGLGDNDVDGGKTTLFSHVLDLSGAVDPRIGYWRWFSNDTGGAPNEDVFIVDVSDDAGDNWENVETVGPGGSETSGGWFFHDFRVADFVTPSSQVQLRFVAADNGSGSVVEAAIDDLVVVDCDFCGLPMLGEIRNLRLGRSSETVAELSWNRQIVATSYNVYRAQDPEAQACYLSGLTSASTSDDGLLLPEGEVLYYVTTSVNCAGESTLGEERVVSVACP